MATCNDCKDCLHYKLCGVFGYVSSVKFCGFYTDRSRFVELPCKVGDTVYIALNGYGVLKDTVKEFRITSRRIWIRPEKFGMDCLLENMAFFTREEAEKVLKERDSND